MRFEQGGYITSLVLSHLVLLKISRDHVRTVARQRKYRQDGCYEEAAHYSAGDFELRRKARHF